MSQIRLGIIGCGIAARELHLPALQNLPAKFKITAVCNHTLEKAIEFAELCGGVPYHQNYQDLLQRTDVDAVDIILPINLNLKVTRDALKAGKHIMVEKPLAASLSEAEEMLSLDRHFDQVKMVAENFRYRPGLLRMRQLLESGIIGTPYSIMWNYFNLVQPSNKYAQTKWRINHTYPGGFITDGGVHNIAGIRLLFGDIIAGSAFAGSQNPDIGSMDTFCYQFVTETGVNGVLNIFISSNGYAENRIIILGQKGSMVYADNTLTVSDHSGDKLHEEFSDDRGYTEEFIDFYEAITHNKMPVSNFIEAYKDLLAIVTAEEQANSWAFKVDDK